MTRSKITYIIGSLLFLSFLILALAGSVGADEAKEKSQFVKDTEVTIRNNEAWLKGFLSTEERNMNRQELTKYLIEEVRKREDSNAYHAGKLSAECFQMDWQNLTSFPVENCSK